ncbi:MULTISPECIES: type II toxin-antitoxin system HipA family toxin [unclassified Corynebacterium]|uniref:type II toxin-antitoxin system HipA family toxin n=1 Tax=unclassified Corynebacterium TaxID=2624378 RepID=UPI0029CA3808|nr:MULTISPECIES: HipA domain-containing protein [unclassified Corynebacterium]WPF65801.1 HipA domain-containing protein [Corynebacterium sp. 22KM0430]WPF68294.1 HipA domain-containing protein [Corynebacterium sp. 21KM1197]
MRDIAQLRFVRAADVYKKGRRAATLERGDNGEISFFYLSEYEGPPVASTLPMSTEPVFGPGGGVPAFFSGLLPEGHRLSVLRRVAKTSLDDELTLLLAIGEDTPGDVQIVPAGEGPGTPEPLISGLPGEIDFRDVAEMVDQYGLPGVQEKASASMVNTPVGRQGAYSILKLDPPEHPHLVFNEALHLSHARHLGIPVAHHQVIRDKNGRPGLLVRRFDRLVAPGGAVVRNGLEDAAQVLDLLPAAKYSVESERVVRALAAKTNSPVVATRNLYMQFLFAWLTGNGDLHAKNLSIVESKSGKWSVAPMYDIPCTALYRDMTLALPLAGKSRNLKRQHWVEFADSIGLSPAAAASANEQVLRVASKIDLSSLPLSGSPLHGALRELERRKIRFA